VRAKLLTAADVLGTPPLTLGRCRRQRAGLKVSDSVKAELLALRPQNFTGRCFVQKR
jgi:hypothetical protein